VSNAFSYELRVLLCPQCGAPVDVSPTGGASPCRFCGAHAEMGIRDESLDLVLKPQRQAISEDERISRLRMQANKPLMPPANIMHLFESGTIPAWKIAEAVTLWQTARRDVLATGNPDAAQAIYFLAMALSGAYGDQKDVPRQRAILESSLEALRLPRHRQALRCMLSRLACRAGDVAAAEQWLGPCDPASDDLEMDTPYRFSRALIATSKKDWQGVLQVLGRGPLDVPILQATETIIVVLRANAVEQLGDVPGAATLLFAYMNQSSEHALRIGKALDYWAPFGLCEKSRAPAQTERRQEQGHRAVARSGGGVGLVFAVVGGLMAVIGAGLLISGLVMGSGSSRPPPPTPTAAHGHGHAAPPPPPPPAMPNVAASGMTMSGGILLLMGLIFGGVGIPIYRSGARAKRLAMSGERATAQVVSAGTTGLSINNVPQYAFTLLVQRPGAAPPYQATVKVLGAGHIRPGASVAVLVDPQDPTSVIFDPG
jgi:hypothetical protein